LGGGTKACILSKLFVLCHYAMFVRFRQAKHRLQVSLVDTRRVDGKVWQEHVAGLGSIDIPPSVEARLAFWQILHDRLEKLSNRIDAAMQRKILVDVHARIPLASIDEQQALKLQNAEANERFWQNMRDLCEDQVNGQNQLAAIIDRSIADGQSGMEEAAAQSTIAKERIERLRKGEDVPDGLGKPLIRGDLIAELTLIASNVRHRLHLRILHELGALAELTKEIRKIDKGGQKTASLKVLRRQLRRLGRQTDHGVERIADVTGG
jgi:hypothetical protein